MPNQTPTITATLQVTPDFTGRVLVYVKNGRATSDRRLFDDDLATRAGYQVISPDTGAAA
ncbi:hypothetical protein ACRQTN_14385 [Pectobacterium brasiliense]|uniref:hypothetical protein n=1 Tax=Pectobacterium brasiliense TaxID=180957 RepID=UPI003EC0FF6E